MECKNCQESLSASDDYCKQCGAKVIRNRITLRNLIESFSEQFLNYDNKFLQTFIDLFKRPEDVIGSYIDGTRKKYVNVISYFAIAITISGLQIYIINKFFPNVIDFSIFTNEKNDMITMNTYKTTTEYQSLLMMFTAPFYALISRVIFLKNKKFNYSEHLVIFMYVLAQLSILGTVITVLFAIIGISIGWTSIILMPIQIVYAAYCLKRLYKLSMERIILKTLLLFLILFVLFLIYTVLYVAYVTWYYGGVQEFIDSQKGVNYINSSVRNWTS